MPQINDVDLTYMRQALELAKRATGMTSPNPVVGAVLVKKGHVIGEGYHRGSGLKHAEIEALEGASESTTGATLYVTLEPCSHQGKTPPCTDAIVAAKIARVVAATTDPNPRVSGEGFRLLQAAGIKVDIGACAHEARHLNDPFFTFMEAKRPFIISKWAMTLDGKIATEIGHSRWISNDKSRFFAHEIRAQVDAVMVGIGTVLADNPILNVRLPNYQGRQPKRIVIDGHLRIPARAKCLQDSAPEQCILATTEAAPKERVMQFRAEGHRVVVLKGRRGIIDLKSLIKELYRLQVQSVVCEGGSGLHGALLEAQLVDKVVAFVSPKIIGGTSSKSPVTGWGIHYMHQAVTLEEVKFRTFDDDMCMEGYVSPEFRRLKNLKSNVVVGNLEQEQQEPTAFSA